MFQIDPEIGEIFEVFVVFDAISVGFPIVFVKGSNTINNGRTSYASHFLKRTLQRFASKTLKIVQKNLTSFFLQPMFTF